MKKIADKVNGRRQSPSDFCWSQQEVNDACAQATAQAQLATTMTKSIARMGQSRGPAALARALLRLEQRA
eukprot:2716480-Pyramimonas_sp.AAC.1